MEAPGALDWMRIQEWSAGWFCAQIHTEVNWIFGSNLCIIIPVVWYDHVQPLGQPTPHAKFLGDQEESGLLPWRMTSPSRPTTSPGGTAWTRPT